MERKGAGHAHEMLAAFMILILVMSFAFKDNKSIMPPIILIIGAVLLIGSISSREPVLMTGSILLLALALWYLEMIR